MPARVKAMRRSERTIPNLKIGTDYFVSFGDNLVHPCKLVRMVDEFQTKMIEIEVWYKSKFVVTDSFGRKSRLYKINHTIYVNEIGSTPEHAVQNVV